MHPILPWSKTVQSVNPCQSCASFGSLCSEALKAKHHSADAGQDYVQSLNLKEETLRASERLAALARTTDAAESAAEVTLAQGSTLSSLAARYASHLLLSARPCWLWLWSGVEDFVGMFRSVGAASTVCCKRSHRL